MHVVQDAHWEGKQGLLSSCESSFLFRGWSQTRSMKLSPMRWPHGSCPTGIHTYSSMFLSRFCTSSLAPTPSSREQRHHPHSCRFLFPRRTSNGRTTRFETSTYRQRYFPQTCRTVSTCLLLHEHVVMKMPSMYPAK